MAGMSDGSFYLPMKYTRKWEWEHKWAVFSFGFFVTSWILTFIFIPNIFEVYSSVPVREIYILLIFGALWGVGAFLFGTALHCCIIRIGHRGQTISLLCSAAVMAGTESFSKTVEEFRLLLFYMRLLYCCERVSPCRIHCSDFQ